MPDEMNAKWLAEQVILPKLNSIEDKIDKQNTAIWEELSKQNTCMTKIKVGVAELKIKCKNISGSLKNLKASFSEHIKDKSSHFNPHFNETTKERVWRKRAEIGVILGGSGGELGLILFIAKTMGWID